MRGRSILGWVVYAMFKISVTRGIEIKQQTPVMDNSDFKGAERGGYGLLHD